MGKERREEEGQIEREEIRKVIEKD